MRLAVCTLSAVLLSGCSWLGFGGGGSSYSNGYAANDCSSQYTQYGQVAQNGYALGAGCGAGMGVGAFGPGPYGQGSYGQGAYGAGAYGAGAYGQNIYGQNTYGQNTYGQNTYGMNGAGAYGAGMNANGFGLRGAQGAGAYGAGAYGAGTNGINSAGNYGAGTVLGGSAPYGAQASGVAGVGQGVGQYATGQYINGQWVASGTSGATGAYGATGVAGGYGTTTVQGAPIYVPQPYPAYYGVGVASGYHYAGGGGYGLRGGAASLPFGIEAGIGTDIAIGGDIFGAKPGGAALGSSTRSVGASDAISYKDAYKNAVSYDLAATYDVDPSTTLIGRLGYSKAKGERVQVGDVTDTTFPGVTEQYYAKWSDLEEVSLEGGVRKYLGGWNNQYRGIRPYAQATAGFTHNDAVSVTQDSATIIQPEETQPFIDAGWTPTASGAIGAEMQVGPRTAIGVEAGLRWRDDLNTNTPSDDRWSVPVKLRGRISF